MARGLWRRLKAAFWFRFNWWIDKPPPDEAEMRKQAGQAAKQRLRDRTSRAIALADAARNELGREAAQHQQLAVRARALAATDEGETRQALSGMIDVETRLSHLAGRYRLLQREAERHVASWIVARDTDDPDLLVQLETLSPDQAELLADSGATQFDASVLLAITEITAEIRQSQIEAALIRLRAPLDLSGFTVTEEVNLAEINELTTELRWTQLYQSTNR